jgi:8-oxo-dGTP pyrophosphatase MutT (NUDIX family)
MTDPQLRLAATAVLLRDTDQGLETLLLRRNAKLAFAAGAWVFPGGAYR